mmetsp:Transcript_15445/g.41689  ORF Transcript_15445/g.41689 Transcript_15445/m.41689 type:complete len:201 (+) Transcript_15445:2092-2694(+)
MLRKLRVQFITAVQLLKQIIVHRLRHDARPLQRASSCSHHRSATSSFASPAASVPQDHRVPVGVHQRQLQLLRGLVIVLLHPDRCGLAGRLQRHQLPVVPPAHHGGARAVVVRRVPRAGCVRIGSRRDRTLERAPAAVARAGEAAHGDDRVHPGRAARSSARSRARGGCRPPCTSGICAPPCSSSRAACHSSRRASGASS